MFPSPDEPPKRKKRPASSVPPLSKAKAHGHPSECLPEEPISIRHAKAWKGCSEKSDHFDRDEVLWDGP